MRNYKLERLLSGETFTTSEKGNSMVGLISSGQEHILEPSDYVKALLSVAAFEKLKLKI